MGGQNPGKLAVRHILPTIPAIAWKQPNPYGYIYDYNVCFFTFHVQQLLDIYRSRYTDIYCGCYTSLKIKKMNLFFSAHLFLTLLSCD